MHAYESALRWLYGLESRGIRLGLERMIDALEQRGHPERGPLYVHIAGTNGKGSVTAMVESVLRHAGLRTGMFTSPHLHRFVERIRIDGEPIDEEYVARWVDGYRNAQPLSPLTLFEVSTLLAFEAFRTNGCEAVALEVGLGGRLDATNVVESTVSVITSIGFDHAQVLGDDLPTIAREKAGILRADVPAVVAVRESPALAAIEDHAHAVEAPLLRIDHDFGARRSGERLDLWCQDSSLESVHLPLLGEHQLDNAACAFAALTLLQPRYPKLNPATMRAGLEAVRWAGRGELVAGRPSYLFDCAHNAEGCVALARLVDTLPPTGRRVLVFGALGDKPHEPMLRALESVAETRIFVSPRVPRAVPPETFAALRPGRVCASLDDALRQAEAQAGDDGLVIVAGSLFLVAEARANVLGVPSDPPTWP